MRGMHDMDVPESAAIPDDEQLLSGPLRDPQTLRVQTYTGPMVAWIMRCSALAMGLNWTYQWVANGSLLGLLIPVLILAVVAITILSFVVQRLARAGRIDATGAAGIAYVLIFSCVGSLVTYQLGGGVRFALSYCALLACAAVFFWPRAWHFMVGTVATLAPPLALVIIAEPASEGRTPALLFGINTVALCVGMYLFVRHGNRRVARLTAAITYQATHDGLTRVLNRSQWMRVVHQRLSGVHRTADPAVVLAIDVDHFKAINDQGGHEAGDRLLVHVADVLTRGLGPTAIIGRIGGDEFLVFLPGVRANEADALGERLHAQLLAKRVVDGAQSVSIGIAEWWPGEPIASLIARADAAMYAIKRAGRHGTRSA